MSNEKMAGPLGPNQRWSARRNREMVLRLLRGEPLDTLSRELGVEQYRLEQWRDKALGGLELALKDRTGEPVQVELGGARGLALRMDHGCQYTSDHFQHQLRWWGIAPSFAFLQQPQTNGVAERFIRTLKEQVVYGRAFRNLEEVRLAVAEFIDLYNRHWRVEKNGFRTPHEMRADHALSEAA